MNDLIKTRASSCDRIAICHYSSIQPEMKIDNGGKWTNFGNAGHSIMADIVKHDMVTMPNISKVIREYEIEDEKALRISCHVGLKEYRDIIRPSIDRNHLITETKHERQIGKDHMLTGHPDIACLLTDQKTLFVGDWKLGDVSNHWHQLTAYAYILLQYFPQVENVLLGQYFLRVNDKTVREFSVDHIMNKWAPQFVEYLNDDSLKPCWDACKYCPIIDCDARERLSQATGKALSVINHNQSTALALASKFEDVKLLQKKIDQYKEHLKDEILITGEPIYLPDGKMLDLIDGHRSTLYLFEALDVLKGYFGSQSTDELLQLLSTCVTIKKGDLMEIVSHRAEHGEKGREAKRVHDEMEMVGAIKTKTHQKLALKKGERK